ncbi:hypothetical protein BDD26_3000 [Xenorhabdus cabanillasii]|uniref:Uncharacterized protein n=1 Tax=Xenorhabdus cabanillasii TaxID=351673 RepID=A0A3D9UF85_9GAMM|nr:hypothetical protein [Xenorhabdus cabanillasii]REF28132.1 hypothetical protein BDD26_3000 [Xenorhabdus cabanillasii]
MSAIKISLCIVLFFITSIIFNNSFAIDLKSDSVIFGDYFYRLGKIKNRSDLYAYYNITFKNNSKYDDLKIEVLNSQCMSNIGDNNISLKPGGRYDETIEDSNGFFEGCTGTQKFLEWEATTYFNHKEYKSCTLGIVTYLPVYFVWQTMIETNDCDLEIEATCDGRNCLNKNVDSNTSYNPSNVVITIKDDNNWESLKITSPEPNSTVDNNYITISGKGRNQDGNLPILITSFNDYIYLVQPTGDGDNWEGQLWMQCGITGTVSIQEIDNSGVTFNGPPCGATIASMQDGQTISAGKYSLSGRVNSDTADDAKRMQVQITGYNNDGTIYIPTTSYTPNVDTGTGEWSLDGLEAVCSIQYKASVSGYSSESQATHQSFLPEKKEVSYSVQNCPVKITNPENDEVVSSTTEDTQNILIKGQAANGSTVDVSYKYNDFESPSYSVSSDSNNWSYEVQGVPVGFITINAVGRNTSGEPIPGNKDEVIILSSKVFSVKTRNDSVFTEFYGTSMPSIDVNEETEETLNAEIEIFLDGFEYSENVESDENGNWAYEYKHYAKRGEYVFIFEENSDNNLYKGRENKILKCIGSDLGMSCVNEN